MDEMVNFLNHFKLSQYYQAIKAEGADSLDDLRNLNDEEAKEVANSANLSIINTKKFVQAVKSLRNGDYVFSTTKMRARNKIKSKNPQKKSRPQHGIIIKYCNRVEGGFGFISYDGPQNIYFHSSAVRANSVPLRRGQKVKFHIITKKNGRTKAINVYVIEKQLNFYTCSVNELQTWFRKNTDNQSALQTFYFSLESNTRIIKSILSRHDSKNILEKYIEQIYDFIGQKALLNPSNLYRNIFNKQIDKFYVDIHTKLCELFTKQMYYASVERHQIIILNILIKLFTLMPHKMAFTVNCSVIIRYIKQKFTDNDKISILLNTLNSLSDNSTDEIAVQKMNNMDNDVELKQPEQKIDNLNDFLNIDVLPSTFVEFIEEPKALPIISKDKGYESSKHLLRTHTFLMSEDLIYALRNGVMEAVANINLKNKIKNLSIRQYFDVSVDHFFENEQSDLMYNISFKHRPIKWKYSKKLIYGSLVLLLNKKQLENINDNPDEMNVDMIWCTVAERQLKYLETDRPSISVQLRKGNISEDNINGKPQFIMFESSDAYFVPYEHVINGLKSLGNSVDIEERNDILPFESILINVENEIALPAYLKDDTVWDFKCILNEPVPIIEDVEENSDDDLFDLLDFDNMFKESYSFNVVKDWPETLNTTLDSSQLIALKHILTKEVAVIQGPPGTGKTYLALKALNILLTNLDKKKKILVAALTNHALDQLLCGILKFEDNIIRIGTRSQCEELKSKSMRAAKRNYLWGYGVPNDAAKIRFHELRKEKEQIIKTLKQLYAELDCGFDETLLLKYQVIPIYKYGMMKNNLTQWRNKRHFIDYHLYSLSRLYNSSNGYMVNNQYDGKWQVVGAKKRKKKAERIGQMFDNYDVDNLFDLYINEPYFWEKINIKRKQIQNEIQQKRLYALSLNQNIVKTNLKTTRYNMKSTAQFIKLSFIPFVNSKLYEVKEEKEHEIKQENEISLMMAERKYLDGVVEDVDQKEKEKYKQAHRVKNRMRKLDWNHFKIKNEEQQCRFAEMMEYEINLEIKIKQIIDETLIELRQVNGEIKNMNKLIETKLLQKSKVIGITTTAAARLMDIINEVKPNVLIFEEAAEILESHIITALNPQLQHLILIGDHKQLRPTAATYKLITGNNLEISLFERLMRAGIDHKVLGVQRRMIPQICDLSSFHYDDEKFEIKNHESTLNREDIQGISKNVIFFDHATLEQEDENIQSKYNIFEAQMIIELTIYLLKQANYKPSNITILTLYRGQQLKIKSLSRKNEILQNILQRYESENRNNKLNIKCVDKYQGCENDIILLSLVRSNVKNKIGFLSIDNRICVALSRAKYGLYVFGNFQLYANVNKTWETIVNIARKNNYLQDNIELKCKQHQTAIIIKNPKDFQNSPEGGCSKPCAQRMECGHVCERLCHSYDHEYVRCTKPCVEVHEKCQHKCPKKCYEQCGECEIIVSKTLPLCAHIVGIKCYQHILTVNCPKLVTKTFKDCKHVKTICCYQKDKLIECDEIIDIEFKHCDHKINNIKCKDKNNSKYGKCELKCDQTLEECGHKCNESCFKCFENGSKHKCGFKCNRIMQGCGHECGIIHPCQEQCPPCEKKCENECPHSKCNKKCGELCVVCKEKCTRACLHHQCTAMCSEQCNFIQCNKHCEQILECGNKCPGVCGEECLPFCNEEKCDQHHLVIEAVEYEEIKNVTQVFDEDFIPRPIYECKKESTFIILTDCGHIIERAAIDRYVSDYRKNNSELIKLIPCPLCQVPIRRCKRYINVINDILKDIEYVKKQIINNQFEVAKRGIVAAMAQELRHSKGHYFKCENGHYYIVGECGGAMETRKCIECDALIGGKNHKSVKGVQLASEMDGAENPKYPTAL